MRIKYNETKKGKCYYIIRSVYKNGGNTSETYEKLGYPEDIMDKYGCSDPIEWMKEHLDKLNEMERKQFGLKILVPYSQKILNPRIPCFSKGFWDFLRNKVSKMELCLPLSFK